MCFKSLAWFGLSKCPSIPHPCIVELHAISGMPQYFT